MATTTKIWISLALTAVLIAPIALLISETMGPNEIMPFWLIATSFLLVCLYFSIKNTVFDSRKFGFLEVFIFVNSLSWVFFGLFGFSTYSNFTATAAVITIWQHVMCVAVFVLVLDIFAGGRANVSQLGWVSDLSERTQRMSTVAILGLVGLHLALTAFRFSLGIVASGTGQVMATASTFQSALLQLAIPLAGATSVLAVFLAFEKVHWRRMLGIGLFLLQVVLAFLAGRRGLIELFLLGSMVWIGIRGFSFRVFITSASILVFLVVVAGPLFLAFRDETNHRGINMVDAARRGAVVAESFSDVVDGYTFNSAISDRYVNNLEHRLGFYEWTVELQQRVLDGASIRYGEVMATSIVEVVPRALFPAKLEFLGQYRIEQKIQGWFGMPVHDAASTLLAYGIADGGWVGAVLYYVVLGLVFSIVLWMLRSANFVVVRLWAASQLLTITFNIEYGATEMLSIARFVLIIIVLDKMFKFLLATRPDTHVREIAK